MTETLMVTEVDCSTGEQVTRPMTAEEVASYNIMRTDAAAKQAEEDATMKARIAAKASALSKLTALGLSEEEAKAIVG